MSGFAGFCDYEESLLEEKYLWMSLARRMARRISHRGQGGGAHVSEHCALGCVGPAFDGPENGRQPVTVFQEGKTCSIAYSGRLYNAPELRAQLSGQGYSFETDRDAETALKAYLRYGEGCAQHLDGAFAFVVDDGLRGRAFLCRDHFGAKPLFYTVLNGRLAFGSEIKALFEFPGVNPVLGREGLCEVFGLGPARTPGCGVFRGIREVKPGHWALYDREGLRERPYFQLEARPHMEDYPATVDHVRRLLEDAVKRQTTPAAPLCALSSGGPNSSVAAAIAAQALKDRGHPLRTYSLKPADGGLPGSPMSSLLEGVLAKDLPGMAGADGSLLRLCRRVKESYAAALCGECAGAIFGGPWFCRQEPFAGFPWSPNLKTRASLLDPELLEALDLENYVNSKWRETLDETPVLRGESQEERRIRQVSYAGVKWFMSTLLEQEDRCGMWSGLEVREIYADRRLVQYVFNVPWEYKHPSGRAKGLLWDAARDLLPDGAPERGETPYPKAPGPEYGALIKEQLSHILKDGLQPIHKVLSKAAAGRLLQQEFDYGGPWFGRLMAGPQLPAYLIQINYWMLHYNIYLDL